jgi:ABC-type multidrug transport system ATPase subunit
MILFLILLTCYVDWLQVSQDERRPFYYPLTLLSKKNAAVVQEKVESNPMVEKDGKVRNPQDSVIIENLSKLYAGSSTMALSNVSLSFSKGEIFGLLGYNGAGKSTLINMLCGVLSSTSGSIKIFGMDALVDRDAIARKTGICSQRDILFDSLTVQEHLYYFAALRGIPSDKLEEKIKSVVQELKMESMLQQTSNVLSGGQKRKLCVAIAFIHEPELVVLDEMSSGVDPENRRVIWDFLFKRKSDRAILLCTHFMDEADLVTDRKAMLTLGKLVCSGTSRFLKQTYDTGYTLSVEKSNSYDDGLFRDVLLARDIQYKVVKNGSKVVEFRLRNADIGRLESLGQDPEYKRMVTSESVLENGLEMIFSDNRVVEEKELTVSDHDRKRILQSMELFKEVSFASKLKDFGLFEFKRTASGMVSLLARLVIPIILLVIMVLQFRSTTVTSVQTSSTRLPIDEDFFNRLILPDVVVQTNNSALTSQDRRFVLDRMSREQVLAAMIANNGTTYVYRGSSAFIGPLFLTVKTLFGNGLKATLEFDQIQRGNVVQGILFAVAILWSYMCFDLGLWMVEEIAESREKLKFLLLSARVPLSAYWIVMIVKLLVFYLPFVIITTVFSPSTFVLPAEFYILYALQLFLLALLLGSYFQKDSAVGILQGLFFGFFTAWLVLLLLSGILSWKSDQGLLYGDILNFTGTGLPFGIMYSMVRGQKTPSSSYMTAILAGHCVLYLILFSAVEMKHLLVKKQETKSTAFVAFQDVTKGFVSFRRLRPVKKLAVDKLNMEISQNELFALLGPNGSGKTTTLSMLTAQQSPDVGAIHVNSVHVASNRLQVIRELGYCPQFDDLLIDSMSVSAHLKLFCSINGMDSNTADDYVVLLLNAFGIERFADYPCGTLSGGTKRKVSVAIATMMPRPLVVLDEASTGLDPLARHKLWSTVRILNKDRTTIMTTHYINETGVCDRIAIMSEGQLKCCDTEHELTKRAKGYNITLYFSHMESTPEEWFHKNIMFDEVDYQMKCQRLPDCAVIQLDVFSLPLFTVLYRLSNAKASRAIEDYSLGRVSMESIFLDIVREGGPKTSA